MAIAASSMSVAKNLHLWDDSQVIHVLTQQDRERVGLLSSGTPGHPDADGIIGPLALEQAGHDNPFHRLERIGVTEETW